jgi:hypothetical protein
MRLHLFTHLGAPEAHGLSEAEAVGLFEAEAVGLFEGEGIDDASTTQNCLVEITVAFRKSVA